MSYYHPASRLCTSAAGALLATLLVSFPGQLTAQGPLAPAGAPAPTMKTLQQVQPRVPIDAINAPSQNVSDDYTISAPGSYYLTANTALLKGSGIHVTTGNVSIDLNGFTLSGSSGNSGILLDPTATGCAIQNGSVSGFNYGINTNAAAVGLSVRSVEADHCHSAGILTGASAIVDSCTVQNNSGNAGLQTDKGSKVSNCTASGNSTIYGILVGDGCVVDHCSAYSNANGDATQFYASGIGSGQGCSVTACSSILNTGMNGFYLLNSAITDCNALGNVSTRGLSGGIFANGFSVITNCFASGNGSSTPRGENAGAGILGGIDCKIFNCLAFSNNGAGIAVNNRAEVDGCVSDYNGTGSTTSGSGIFGGQRVTVRHCSTMSNANRGILLNGDCTVIENHCSSNGQGAAAAGIDTSGGAGSRIEGNSTRDNVGVGILATTGDIVIRNNSGGNTTNYNPSTGVNFAPVQTPSNATSPLANF